LQYIPNCLSKFNPNLRLINLHHGTIDYVQAFSLNNNNNNNNNIYLFTAIGLLPVAVVILHIHKTWNWLLLNLSREGYMRNM